MYKWLWDRATGTVKGIHLKYCATDIWVYPAGRHAGISSSKSNLRVFGGEREMLIGYVYVSLYIENHVQGTLAIN